MIRFDEAPWPLTRARYKAMKAAGRLTDDYTFPRIDGWCYIPVEALPINHPLHPNMANRYWTDKLR